MNKTKKLSTVTMMVALAVIFHALEAQIPLPLPMGVRLGIANVVGLIAFYKFDFKTMCGVNITRAIIGSLITGLFLGSTFWISLSGVVISTIAAYIFKKFTPMSIIGVSCACATFHIVGQMLMVIVYYNQPSMIVILPYLLASGVPTGLLTGYIAKAVIKRVR